MEWQVQEFRDSQACVRVKHSENIYRSDRGCLEVEMDLIAGDANRSKGEVFVDLSQSPPAGVKSPINLLRHTLTAYVLAPRAAGGEWASPNGFQLFVKDVGDNAYYGQWKNCIPEQWIRLSAEPGRVAPPGGYADPAFDPSRIKIIGIKMGCGDQSRARFKGSIYIDDVDW